MARDHGDAVLDMSVHVQRFDTRAEWLAARQLGGSDIPAILGLGKRAALAVYARRKGLVPDDDSDEGSYVMKRGRALEAGVLELLSDAVGVAIDHTPLTIVTNDAWPGCHYSPDGIGCMACMSNGSWIGDDKPEHAEHRFLVEIKTGDRRQWENGAPDWVEAQARFGMALMGLPRALVGIFYHFRRPPDHVWIEREPSWEERTKVEVARFLDAVERGEPPPPDGSESARDAIAALWPRERRVAVRLSGDDVLAAADRRKALGSEIRRLEREHDEASQIIKRAMGDAEAAVLEDGRVFTLKTITRKGYTVAEKSFRQLVTRGELPEGVELG